MPRKPRTKREPKQKQSQKQIQQVIVNLPEQKPKRRRAKRAPKQPVVETREFPRTIYQSVPVYIHEDQSRYSNLIPSDLTTLMRPEPKKVQQPILEDIGRVGTSQIIDVPTRREQLSEMIEPVPDEPSRAIARPVVDEPSRAIARTEQTARMSLPSNPIADMLPKRERSTRMPFLEEDIPQPSMQISAEKRAPRLPAAEEEEAIIEDKTLLGARVPKQYATPKVSMPRKPRRDSKQGLVDRYNRIFLDMPINVRDVKEPVKDFKKRVEKMEQEYLRSGKPMESAQPLLSRATISPI